MIEDRRAAILCSVVQEYVETGMPVGSESILRSAHLDVSSATVRKEMAELEKEGLLIQPHTSAGRIPTDKGYRFFVDQLSAPGVLSERQRREIATFFDRSYELERMLQKASELLAQLTHCAALVTLPPPQVATVRHAHMVRIDDGRVLAVVVLSTGTVEKCAIKLNADPTDEDLGRINNGLNEHLVGKRIASLNARGSYVDPSLDPAVVRVFDILDQRHNQSPDSVFVGGASHLAIGFGAVETVRNVLIILEEEKQEVIRLLSQTIARSPGIAIGVENGSESLAPCSLVAAPYAFQGDQAGTIGILGPTRMNYPKVLAAVNEVGKQLSDALA